MKKLNKISRENLKAIKGGITQDCIPWWSSGRPYYTNEATCLQSLPTNPDFEPSCINKCGRWYTF